MNTLEKPAQYFHLIGAEDKEVLRRVQQTLVAAKFHMSDEQRNLSFVNAYVEYLLRQRNKLMYVVEGPTAPAGIITFHNIIPGWKADGQWCVWDWTGWGPTRIRAGRQMVETVEKLCKLHYIRTWTADDRVLRLLTHFVSFTEEGLQKEAFAQDDKLYDVHLLVRHTGEQHV